MTIDFTLPITTGGEFTLSTLDKPLVLFFYPRDNTPGCTVENQDFSSLYAEFIALGYEVLGISRDKHTTHCNFQKNMACNISYWQIQKKLCVTYLM